MATDPRIPVEDATKPRSAPDGRKLRLLPRRRGATSEPMAISGRSVFAGLLGVAIVAAMFYYASRVPERARIKDQVTGAAAADSEGPESELELSDLQMTQASANGRLDIYGQAKNSGNHRIRRAVVQLTFKDAKGKTIETVQKPIQGRMKEEYRTLADESPIEPDQSRFFQVSVNQVPAKWDHNMPELKVITVSTDMD